MTEEMIPPAPNMRSYGRQMFICQHDNCASAEMVRSLQASVRPRLGDLRRLRNPERVKVTLSECLGVCSGGPVVVVYPDGIWYHHVTEEVMARIVDEHIIGGVPVEEYVFYRLYPAGQEPMYAPEARGDKGTYEGQTSLPSGEASSPAPEEEEPFSEPIDAEERRRAARRNRIRKGLVIVNTGEGKGKTTAALGVMTRAWGRNMKVGLMQFVKHEKARWGEIKAVEKMEIERIGFGDGWTWTSKDMDVTEARAVAGWEVAKEKVLSGEYEILILDEFTYPLHFGWLDTNEVVRWLKENKPEMMHLIITGRYAPKELVEYADLVTEMKNIKHPFERQGILAQKGIEF
ncbi:MAG: cob(I)yrinic acid a,c-diamide adenosyltransferase [Chloroflexota bacterium]